MIARRREGQVLVLFAVSLLAMVTIVGVVFTWGLVLAQRTRAQTAADATALRGAWQVLYEQQSLRRSDTSVREAIVAMAGLNGIPNDGSPTNATNLSAWYTDATGADLMPIKQVGSGGTFASDARGVRIIARNNQGAVFPGLIRLTQIRLEGTATAAGVSTATIAASQLAVSIAVHINDFRSAFDSSSVLDLFSPTVLPAGIAPSLNFTGGATSPSTGADTYGSPQTNMQYWSDGQHTNGTLTAGGTVQLAGALFSNEIATGLQDNVRRQGLVDGDGEAYALITVPLWEGSSMTPARLNVVGFGMMKIRGSDISQSAARGQFVAFPAAASGPVQVLGSTGDVGAWLIRMVQ